MMPPRRKSATPAEEFLRGSESIRGIVEAAQGTADLVNRLGVSPAFTAAARLDISPALAATARIEEGMEAARTLGEPLYTASRIADSVHLAALDRSIASATSRWQQDLVAATNFDRTALSVGSSIAEAFAARQTFVSEPLMSLRALGIETPIGITGAAAHLERIRATMEGPFAALAREAEVTRSALADLYRPAALAATFDWGERFRALNQRQRRHAVALLKDGWVVMPDWPVSWSRKLVKLRLEKGKVALDRAIVELYRQDDYDRLGMMVEEWESEAAFRARRRIIRDALGAHREGRYTLTIPALLPLIEGVVVETFAPTVTNPDAAKLFKSSAAAQHAEGVLIEGLVGILDALHGWVSFVTVSRRSRALNRHSILHGRTIGYPTERNSLKVFMVLGLLASEARSKRDTGDTEAA